YYLQIAIGIYLIQIIFILTRTLVTIDSGEDRLQQTNQVGRNLKAGITFYLVTSFIAILVLFALSSIVVGGFG
ncbi:hypothetical protein HYT24_01690, partial [Candidatus Pacearchaeota archaeon]|nr:hypothetical protein [Candidatus Pacearchaeota archaeon]